MAHFGFDVLVLSQEMHPGHDGLRVVHDAAAPLAYISWARAGSCATGSRGQRSSGSLILGIGGRSRAGTSPPAAGKSASDLSAE